MLTFAVHEPLRKQVGFVCVEEELDMLSRARQHQGVGGLLSRGAGATDKQQQKLQRKSQRLAVAMYQQHMVQRPQRGDAVYLTGLYLLREREVRRLCGEIEDISLNARAMQEERSTALNVQTQQRLDKKVRALHTKIRKLGSQLEAWKRAGGIPPPREGSRLLVVPAALTQDDYNSIFSGQYPWGEPSASERMADKYFDARCEVRRGGVGSWLLLCGLVAVQHRPWWCAMWALIPWFVQATAPNT